MNRLPIILRCVFIGALFAVGSMLFELFGQSALQVLMTVPEADVIAWLVVLCVPAVMAVIFAQAFREMRKLIDKLAGDDPDSKIERLEKRISELEKGKADG